MDYKNKYEQALEKARIWKYKSGMPKDKQGILDDIFPELKESGDERIRKELIDFVKSRLAGFPQCEKFVAWLEKQGKNKSIDDLTQQEAMDIAVAKCFNEQKPADKIEPKFKVGDTVKDPYGDVYHIVEINNDSYKTDDGRFILFENEDAYSLWTIQDAKDGDVLAIEPIEGYYSPFVAIYKKQNEEDFDSYCFIGFDGRFYKGENGHSTEEVHPATKEQRDTLEKAMADAGYTFDFEKRELKKFEQKPTGEEMKVLLQTEYEKGRADAIAEMQKSWNEEDEKQLNNIMWIIEAYRKNGFNETHIQIADNSENWLKSLKDRMQLQQELPAKPQSQWKPSDEQIEILDIVLTDEAMDDNIARILRELQEVLKKLKG